MGSTQSVPAKPIVPPRPTRPRSVGTDPFECLGKDCLNRILEFAEGDIRRYSHPSPRSGGLVGDPISHLDEPVEGGGFRFAPQHRPLQVPDKTYQLQSLAKFYSRLAHVYPAWREVLDRWIQHQRIAVTKEDWHEKDLELQIIQWIFAHKLSIVTFSVMEPEYLSLWVNLCDTSQLVSFGTWEVTDNSSFVETLVTQCPNLAEIQMLVTPKITALWAEHVQEIGSEFDPGNLPGLCPILFSRPSLRFVTFKSSGEAHPFGSAEHPIVPKMTEHWTSLNVLTVDWPGGFDVWCRIESFGFLLIHLQVEAEEA
jgi:hypothetical protein